MDFANISGYFTGMKIDANFVTIRSEKYPVTAVHPTGARFNAPGQTAFYLSSGMPAAKAERLGDSEATMPSGENPYSISEGMYQPVFDLRAYLIDHPEEQNEILPTTGNNRYDRSRELRSSLELAKCCGVIYPSQKFSGGVNVALWPLGDLQFSADSFVRLTGYSNTSFGE